MSILEIQTPRVFAPLLGQSRYKGAHGGRGSGKSHFFAESLVERAMLQPGLRWVCIREIQKSLEQSSKRLIEDKIGTLGVGGHFRVLDKHIETPGDGLIIFQGMQNHTAESIKSLEGYDGAWVEEAQGLSAYSLRLLRPTIRKPGSELWFSWNPKSDEDPVDQLLRGPNAVDNRAVVQANWRDNPWFPEVLEAERLSDWRNNPDTYDHVWEGAYLTRSEAQVLNGKWRIDRFETPDDVGRIFLGADWGFSVDPSALIRFFIKDRKLFIEHEAYGVGVELEELPAFFDSVPEARKWPIKADGARPETISHMKRKGFNISAAEKWTGCVEDGVAYLRGFDEIVIHERCRHTAQEARLWSYKTDRQTEEVLPILVDANNHAWDAIRYGLDGYIRKPTKPHRAHISIMGR